MTLPAALSPAVLRPAEAAAYLGISRSKLYALLQEGAIRTITLYTGGPTRLARADLDSYVEARRRIGQDALQAHLTLTTPQRQVAERYVSSPASIPQSQQRTAGQQRAYELLMRKVAQLRAQRAAQEVTPV